MKTQKYNIYILGNNPSKLADFRNFLMTRFKNKVNVYLYFNNKDFQRRMHSGVDLVILDSLNEEETSPQEASMELKIIKSRFPKTEVIVHTSNDDVAVAVEAMHSGAKDYIVKHDRSWQKIGILADNIIIQPIRALFAEWGVVKFCAIFFVTFCIIGVVTALTLEMAHFF